MRLLAKCILVAWIIVGGVSALAELFSLRKIPIFDANSIDKLSILSPPGTIGVLGSQHWLGTDIIGRDVLAGILHGSSIAFLLCVSTLLLSLILGSLLGIAAAYFKNNRLKASFISILSLILWIGLSIYSGVYGISGNDTWIYTGATLLLFLLGYLANRYHWYQQTIPLDSIVIRTITIFESIPALILILTLSTLSFFHTLLGLIGLFTFFYSIHYAKYFRNESKAIVEESYIHAARISGLPTLSIIWRHVFPNALSRLRPVVIYSVISMILTEATLSFLGIGIAVEEVTWGKLIAMARSAPEAWWLALPAGLAIFSIVFSLRVLSKSRL